MRYALALCLLLPAAHAVSAQEVLTFDQAVAMALEHNPNIQVARNSAAMAKSNIHIGNAGFLPRLDLMGAATYQNTNRTPGLEGRSTLTSAQAQVRHTLFDGFGNVYRFRKLKVEGELGELEARNQIENTLFAVAQAYYAAAAADENLRIVRERLAVSRERLGRTEKRVSFGQARTVDVLAAQVDLNTDSVTVAQAQLRWQEAVRNLNVLMNREEARTFTIDREVRFAEIPSEKELQQSAAQNNASYRASVQALQGAKMSLKITDAARWPRLDLTASYGYTQTAKDLSVRLDDPDETWNVGATLTFNVFNGFQTRIQRQNARIGARNQQLREEQARLDLGKELTNAYEAYRNSRLILDLERQNLNAAETNFRRTQELYDLGQVTGTQFREAQLNLIRAKSNIAGAKYTAKLNEVYLLRLTGRLLF